MDYREAEGALAWGTFPRDSSFPRLLFKRSLLDLLGLREPWDCGPSLLPGFPAPASLLSSPVFTSSQRVKKKKKKKADDQSWSLQRAVSSSEQVKDLLVSSRWGRRKSLKPQGPNAHLYSHSDPIGI